MKIVSQQQFDEYNAATRYGGLTSLAGGAAAAGAASVALNRFSPTYRNNLTLPLKVFGVVAVSSFAFVIGADRAGAAYEAQRYDPGKESKELDLENKLFGKGDQQQAIVAQSAQDKAMEWVTKHRYQTVGGAWAASMVGSFAYVASQPMSFAQKLVQARMLAQGLTVGVLLVTAGLASTSPRQQAEENETKADEMYKWNKNSPHEQKKHQA